MAEQELEQQVDSGAGEEQQSPGIDPKTEYEARMFGWVPREEFRGSDDDWVDAETFVKRGKEINPILRKNNEILMHKLEEKSREIEGIKASVEEFKKFQKEAFERKQQEYEVQIAELKTRKKEAIAEGNGDLVVDIDDQIDAIKEEQKAAKQETKENIQEFQQQAKEQQQQFTADPELMSWLNRNQWFGSDVEMTDVANGLGAAVRKQFPHLSGREFLDKLDEKVAEYFPHKFTKSRGSAVDSTGNVRGGSGGGKKSYDNLPKDAQEACDRFIKNGWIKNRQEYLDNYDWS